MKVVAATDTGVHVTLSEQNLRTLLALLEMKKARLAARRARNERPVTSAAYITKMQGLRVVSVEAQTDDEHYT